MKNGRNVQGKIGGGGGGGNRHFCNFQVKAPLSKLQNTIINGKFSLLDEQKLLMVAEDWCN